MSNCRSELIELSIVAPTPYSRDLSHGMTGADVESVNERLTELGWPVSGGDLYGFRTERSVLTLQDHRNVVRSGVLNHAGWTALFTTDVTFDGFLYEDAPQTGTGPAPYAED
jgi:hypothetical protein